MGVVWCCVVVQVGVACDDGGLSVVLWLGVVWGGGWVWCKRDPICRNQILRFNGDSFGEDLLTRPTISSNGGKV